MNNVSCVFQQFLTTFFNILSNLCNDHQGGPETKKNLLSADLNLIGNSPKFLLQTETDQVAETLGSFLE